MSEDHTSIQHQSREEYVENKMKNHSQFYSNFYKVLYTVNDFTSGLWFFIGSILFYFSEPMKTWGVTLFVLGSIQFMVRPTIRLVHEAHARKHYGKQYDKST
ncbi:YrhK family protein [Salimicrobium flavidum]|uniref:YrhK-like protein n=1 Tax=Salimicrobium flavidum TaxID=570947 RepID=A0A1N7IT81_9BACI|nr:YrhK family protein [Salimicrobium flavidum]SIS40216.1 YrhK-like protein [Salimicrobium flavidum]